MMNMDDLFRQRFLGMPTKPGDKSMEPPIPAGAMIITSNDPMCLGKICAVYLEGNRVLIKRLFYEGGDDLVGRASNLAYRYFEWHRPLKMLRAIRPVVAVYDREHPPFLEGSAVRH